MRLIAHFCNMLKHLLPLVIISMTLIQCKRQSPAVNLPESSGSPGEVFLVAHEDILDQVQNGFKTDYKQPSPVLIIAENAEKQQFENSLLFYGGRHQSYEGSDKYAPLILVAEAGKKAGNYSEDLSELKPIESIKGSDFSLDVYRNVWAKPQTVLRLSKSSTGLSAELASTIEKVIYQHELKQGLPGNLAPTSYCDSVSGQIRGNYGFSFKFPPQFRLEFNNREVVWMWQETQQFYRHLFCNIFSDSQLIDSKEKAIANRNLFTSRYLKNDEGTKVKISESQFFPLIWEENVSMGNHKISILRGWYTEEGTYRRGPFVRYFFHDQANKRYVVLDGFLHAPRQHRLPYYRTFDLIAGSLQLH